jgi:hypothetical protein
VSISSSLSLLTILCKLVEDDPVKEGSESGANERHSANVETRTERSTAAPVGRWREEVRREREEGREREKRSEGGREGD